MASNIGNTLLLLAALGLVACGGGGGSGTNPPVGNPVVSTVLDPLPLTAANAPAAAGEVGVDASTVVGAGVTSVVIVSSVSVHQPEQPSLTQITPYSLDLLGRMPGQIPPTVSGVVINVVDTCSGGGTVALTWDDADNNTDFSTGDTFILTFTGCIELGFTLNGTIALTGFTRVGDPMVMAPWTLGATLTFTGLQLSLGAQSVRIDGDMSYAANTGDGVNVATVISGNTLIVREGGYASTLRSFDFSYTENLNTLAYSLDYSGTVDAQRIDGRVTFQTTSPFTGVDILGTWPTGGSVLITGANSSTVELTAQGGDNVRLDLDANGDTAIDQTINTTWSAITNF